LLIDDLMFDDINNITTIKIRRIKTYVDYYAFLTPETTFVVKDYMKYRNRTSDDKRKSKALLKQKHILTVITFSVFEIIWVTIKHCKTYLGLS